MKAILVIDMPESCTSCLLGIYHKRWFCLKTLKDIEITDRYHIPDWCPLKPLPEKLYVEANRIEDLMPSEFDMDKLALKIQLDADKIFAFGWNKCLEEIEK